jgi:hypothetical protein
MNCVWLIGQVGLPRFSGAKNKTVFGWMVDYFEGEVKAG